MKIRYDTICIIMNTIILACVLCGLLSITVYVRKLLGFTNVLLAKNAELLMENKRIKNSMVTHETSTARVLSGIFEIHITVDPLDNYVSLLSYVKQYEKIRGMKVVYAVSSEKNNQYMLSYFTRKDDDKLAIESANKTADELKQLGIKVVRTKVEGHGVEGTPMTTEDYKLVESYLHDKYNGLEGKPYFEFHVKVGNKENEHLDYEKLEMDVEGYEGVAISYNLCSAEKKPLLTIRVYNDGFLNAQAYKDLIINNMKRKAYVFESKIQQEFSIYDTNSSLDEGWLIHQ